jgi:hypothetical protein
MGFYIVMGNSRKREEAEREQKEGEVRLRKEF